MIRVPLIRVAKEWTRIGCLGFGGPPAHISLFRRLCVTDRGWLSESEFEDGIAATNLLPGPASTQLAIFCAWRLRGTVGALVGGVCFIAPGLIIILALAAVFLGSPPSWIQGAAAGAGAVVAPVAVHAAAGLVPGSWRRVAPFGGQRFGGQRWRWGLYLVLGGVAGSSASPFLVLVLLICGLLEILARRRPRLRGSAAPMTPPNLAVAWSAATIGGSLGGVAWLALKVGLLSYGGGFVIIPLMQGDAVNRHHWMSSGQFLNAVALGQITPGPVVHTVAVVGYAAAGLGGGLLAALIAFAPSFVFVIFGAPRFDRLRANSDVQAFLTGAGPAVIGAIAGSAFPLARALSQPWQFAVLAVGTLLLFPLRRGVVTTLLCGALLGVIAALIGLPIALP